MSILIAFLVAVVLVGALVIAALMVESRRFIDVCTLCGHPRIEHSDGACAREQCTCPARTERRT